MRALCLIRQEPYYRRAAFESGLMKVGFKLCHTLTPSGPEDWMVIWNRKKGLDETNADEWERRGGTVIVAENGYLQKVDKTIYAISVHGHNGSGWFPIGDEDRFSKLGFALKPYHEDGRELIVRAQRGIGSTLMASPPGWAERWAAKLRLASKYPVRIVPHPGDKLKMELDAAALKQARAVHIWSSALGVRALVEGINVCHNAPHWICQNWPADREAALHKMAHGQWHHEEIATGEPFARIIANRSKASW